jgi:hypothetical protein
MLHGTVWWILRDVSEEFTASITRRVSQTTRWNIPEHSHLHCFHAVCGVSTLVANRLRFVSEVLTAVKMSMLIFWVETPSGLAD